MRWFVGSVAALLLVWGLYTASPYWAFLDFADAVEGRNVQRIADRVNFRAVRASFTKQIVAEAAGSRAASKELGVPDASMAASGLAVAAEPLLERLVTPEGMLGLLQDLSPGRAEPMRLASRVRPSLDGLRSAAQLILKSRWRGFRNVYFTVPPEAAEGLEARLHFRFGRLKWRLASIEISAETRRRLLDELVRLHGERTRR
jgi:hypothetical protein